MRTKAGSSLRRHLRKRFPYLLITVAAAQLACLTAKADGFFVAPKFVWDKHKDINEPTQKAIIVHDAGREDLILQVKYSGPVEEFGWLIPVPNLPVVKAGSMECFYELSKYTQKFFVWGMDSKGVMERGGDAEPPLKVVEIKTVGAYEVAVLSTTESGALEHWLGANGFSVPADKSGVIDSYVKRQWYFVAAKINLNKAKGFLVLSGAPKQNISTKAVTESKLADGELDPIHISFRSEQCVFPLKISSLGGHPSEVQLYVLSPEPLIEKGMFAKKLVDEYHWRTNMLARHQESRKNLQMLQNGLAGMRGLRPPEPENGLSLSSEINDEDLLPYREVAGKDLPECSKQIALIRGRKLWLTKQTWTFAPDEMRDLEFVPAIPVLNGALADSEGAFAAANLIMLGTNGGSALLRAVRDPNPAVRTHAASAMDRIRYMPGWKDSALSMELRTLLPALLNDPDPEVRLHAVYAAADYQNDDLFEPVSKLLRDDHSEIVMAAISYLQEQRQQAMKHIPMFKQMLSDTNANLQMAGLRVLNALQVQIPREDLLALLHVPRMEVAGAAVALLRKDLSCEEAKPLLQNSLPLARLIGVSILMKNMDAQSVEFALPMLKDSEEPIRTRAHSLLTDLTGQNIPADQPAAWEKWWSENKATFVVTISREELREKQLKRLRQRTGDGARPPLNSFENLQ